MFIAPFDTGLYLLPYAHAHPNASAPFGTLDDFLHLIA
eukprot:gene12705-34015_t